MRRTAGLMSLSVSLAIICPWRTTSLPRNRRHRPSVIALQILKDASTKINLFKQQMEYKKEEMKLQDQVKVRRWRHTRFPACHLHSLLPKRVARANAATAPSSRDIFDAAAPREEV
jgi:hypothetical protein